MIHCKNLWFNKEKFPIMSGIVNLREFKPVYKIMKKNMEEINHL